jgi:hypothetical protein
VHPDDILENMLRDKIDNSHKKIVDEKYVLFAWNNGLVKNDIIKKCQFLALI